MQATVVYPKEIAVNFAVPCIEPTTLSSLDVAAFLQMVQVAFTSEQSDGFLAVHGLRPIKAGDLVIVHAEPRPAHCLYRGDGNFEEVGKTRFLALQKQA